MILAIDVYYIDNRAKSVGVLFHHWTDLTSVIEQVITDYQDNVEPYQSGQFYQRELPCIMSPVIFTQLFTKTLTVMRYMILMMTIPLNFKNWKKSSKKSCKNPLNWAKSMKQISMIYGKSILKVFYLRLLSTK